MHDPDVKLCREIYVNMGLQNHSFYILDVKSKKNILLFQILEKPLFEILEGCQITYHGYDKYV